VKKAKEFMVHPNYIEAHSIEGSKGKFHVKKIGSKVSHVKVGDIITSSDLDDLHDTGHKVKEVWKKK